MRVDYRFELSEVEIPRFSVEAVEGIGKLFTLATLVLNVLETKKQVEIVFHGLSADDPDTKLKAFQEIIAASNVVPELNYHRGVGGRIVNSSSNFCWVLISR